MYPKLLMRNLRKQAKNCSSCRQQSLSLPQGSFIRRGYSGAEASVEKVNAAFKDKTKGHESLKSEMENLDQLPQDRRKSSQTFWSDNIEVVLVAAILVIGICISFSAFYHSDQFDVSYVQRDELSRYDTPTNTEPSLPMRLFRSQLGANTSH